MSLQSRNLGPRLHRGEHSTVERIGEKKNKREEARVQFSRTLA